MSDPKPVRTLVCSLLRYSMPVLPFVSYINSRYGIISPSDQTCLLFRDITLGRQYGTQAGDYGCHAMLGGL